MTFDIRTLLFQIDYCEFKHDNLEPYMMSLVKKKRDDKIF